MFLLEKITIYILWAVPQLIISEINNTEMERVFLFVCVCVWLFIISVCGRLAQLFVDQWKGKNITVEGIVGTTYLWQLGNWKTEMDMTKSISPVSYFLNKAPILLVPASFQMYHHSFNWWEKWHHWWIWDVILKERFKSFWTLQY